MWHEGEAWRDSIDGGSRDGEREILGWGLTHRWGRWHVRGDAESGLGWGIWSADERSRLKYLKFGSEGCGQGPLTGQWRMGPCCSPLGRGSSKGPGTRESRRILLCGRKLKKMEGRGGPKTHPKGTQHRGWAAGSTQYGRRVMELGCPRSQRGRGGAKQEVRKQGYRAKVRTKRKPLSLVSPDEAIRILRVGRTGD